MYVKLFLISLFIFSYLNWSVSNITRNSVRQELIGFHLVNYCLSGICSICQIESHLKHWCRNIGTEWFKLSFKSLYIWLNNKLLINMNKIKCDIAIGKGKKTYDQRQDVKQTINIKTYLFVQEFVLSLKIYYFFLPDTFLTIYLVFFVLLQKSHIRKHMWNKKYVWIKKKP